MNGSHTRARRNRPQVSICHLVCYDFDFVRSNPATGSFVCFAHGTFVFLAANCALGRFVLFGVTLLTFTAIFLGISSSFGVWPLSPMGAPHQGDGTSLRGSKCCTA